ncbi:YybH family protein [Nocardioides sp.]|uniref:YybH family protein n=1 Tax=Nocardioides sp. TaxID=35761 RepID=UPI003D13425E
MVEEEAPVEGAAGGRDAMATTREAAVEAAHRAYYAAWEAGDGNAIMAAWADDDRICCVLPGNPPHHGRVEVWDRILEGLDLTPGLQFVFSDVVVTVRDDLARLTCVETVITPETFDQGPEMEAALAKLAVTSLFVHTDHGWKLWHHQAGPMLTHLRLERE